MTVRNARSQGYHPINTDLGSSKNKNIKAPHDILITFLKQQTSAKGNEHTSPPLGGGFKNSMQINSIQTAGKLQMAPTGKNLYAFDQYDLQLLHTLKLSPDDDSSRNLNKRKLHPLILPLKGARFQLPLRWTLSEASNCCYLHLSTTFSWLICSKLYSLYQQSNNIHLLLYCWPPLYPIFNLFYGHRIA